MKLMCKYNFAKAQNPRRGKTKVKFKAANCKTAPLKKHQLNLLLITLYTN
jgi:hypothetical protein